MGLFFRRPFALFALIFLLSAVLLYDTSIPVLVFGIILVSVIIACVSIFAFAFKKIKMKLLVVAVCISAVLIALLQSLFCVAIPVKKAEAYKGENVVHCSVIDEIDKGNYGKSYIVKIKRIGDEAVSIRANLTCGFTTELRGGDEIYGSALILAERGEESSQLICLVMDDPENCYARYTSEGKGKLETLLSEDGIEILSCRLSDFICDKLYSILGEERGALAMGFFTGERSGMPDEITRDFRRSGVSHLMAVSGSHIAILLGGIELILRKLKIHKNIRIITVSFFSIGFLFITGFSLSAIRAVLMLYAVYLAYFLRDINDSITALFASILVIVFIFPHSIVDLGLWMSFLATLGLLTAYPIVEEKIPYPKRKSRLIRFVLKTGRELLLIAIMTIVANMYLLPIIWLYFEEFSLVSVISNILITYPSSLFLLSVPIMLLTYRIPILGAVIKGTVSLLADLIIYVVSFCSRLPNATVSLKYEFCKYIVIGFVISMTVFLVVRFKRKIFALLPFGLAAVSFAVCFSVYSLFIASPSVTYLNYGRSEVFAVNDNTELSVYDSSSGGISAYWQIRGLMDDSYATCIDKYVFSDYKNGNLISIELLSKNILINSLYLPVPVDDGEIALARELYELAVKREIDVVFYNNGDVVQLTDGVRAQIVREGSGIDGVNILFECDGRSIAYGQAEHCNTDGRYDILIIGEDYDKNKTYDLRNIRAEKIYLPSNSLSKRVLLPTGSDSFVPSDDGNEFEIKLSFK